MTGEITFNSHEREDRDGRVGVGIQNHFKMQQKVSALMTVTVPGLIPPMDATFRVLIVQMNISLKGV